MTQMTQKTGSGLWTRRQFVERAAMGAAAAALLSRNGFAASTGPLGLPIGSQVWPLRGMLKDFPGFAKKIAAIGVTRLELCSPIGYGSEFSSLADGKQAARIMADHGLKAESSHFTMDELRKSQQKCIDWAREIGITQMITATLGDGNGGSHPTLDQVKRAAEEYNKIAAVAAAAGMQQGLHNEGFEVSMVEGRRTYDRLFDLLDPQLVKFQFQMSTLLWGFVAADYFVKYPGRFYSMHLQDIDLKGVDLKAPASDDDEKQPQAALGQGSIDWVKTFRAAKIGGVKNYFVEQTWELTERSVAYLKVLKV